MVWFAIALILWVIGGIISHKWFFGWELPLPGWVSRKIVKYRAKEKRKEIQKEFLEEHSLLRKHTRNQYPPRPRGTQHAAALAILNESERNLIPPIPMPDLPTPPEDPPSLASIAEAVGVDSIMGATGMTGPSPEAPRGATGPTGAIGVTGGLGEPGIFAYGNGNGGSVVGMGGLSGSTYRTIYAPARQPSQREIDEPEDLHRLAVALDTLMSNHTASLDDLARAIQLIGGAGEKLEKDMKPLPVETKEEEPPPKDLYDHLKDEDSK